MALILLLLPCSKTLYLLSQNVCFPIIYIVFFLIPWSRVLLEKIVKKFFTIPTQSQMNSIHTIKL
jgi:hypothetical protein